MRVLQLMIAIALKGFTDELLAEGLQVSSSNPLSGLSGRAALLRRLGTTLEKSSFVFGQDNVNRPGYMLGSLYFLSKLTKITSFLITALRWLKESQSFLYPLFGMSL